MNDDDFVELLRSADPAHAIPPTVTEVEVQANLAKVRLKARRARHRRQAWLAVPAAAALLAVVFVVQPWGPNAAPAYAATPPMLEVAPAEANSDQVVEQARRMLAASPKLAAERRSQSQGWYLAVDYDAAGQHSAVVVPQEHDVAWEPDLSGRITVTAGVAYRPGDAENQLPPADAAPAPGTVISDDQFGPGEMGVLFPSAPPSSVDELRYYLEAGAVDPGAGSQGYVDAVRLLLDEWTLGPAEEAAVIGLLGTLDGVDVAGTATDRLGRPAMVLRLRAPEVPHQESVLLIGSDTGRLLALETVYLGGLEELNIPSPSVVSYVAWH